VTISWASAQTSSSAGALLQLGAVGGGDGEIQPKQVVGSALLDQRLEVALQVAIGQRLVGIGLGRLVDGHAHAAGQVGQARPGQGARDRVIDQHRLQARRR
jgi:hypothetical protein